MLLHHQSQTFLGYNSPGGKAPITAMTPGSSGTPV